MSRLLLDLEIDLACAEFLRARGYSVAQPVIIMLEQADELDEAPHASGENSPCETTSRGDDWRAR